MEEQRRKIIRGDIINWVLRWMLEVLMVVMIQANEAFEPP